MRLLGLCCVSVDWAHLSGGHVSSDNPIASHYGLGGLRGRLQAGIDAVGGDVTIDVLAPADEFHIGGRPATTRLIEQLALGPGDRVLDVGSGIGGPARYMAATTGAHVTGVDLTEEYQEVGQWLSALVGLEDKVTLHAGNALDLAFESGSFDAATMLHVGMNIDAKHVLFAEVARVLRPGGRFVVYDVMAGATTSDLEFPLPWAAGPATSFVESPATYVEALEAAGLAVEVVNDRSASAIEFFEQMKANAVGSAGPPPLGLHLVMGPETPTKLANMVTNLRAGRITPTEILSSVPG